MLKLMTFLRSVFLVFVVAYAMKVMPLALLMSTERTRSEVMVPFSKLEAVSTVTWTAVGWIALEVVVGWLHVWVAGKLAARAAARAGGSVPPPAPAA